MLYNSIIELYRIKIISAESEISKLTEMTLTESADSKLREILRVEYEFYEFLLDRLNVQINEIAERQS